MYKALQTMINNMPEKTGKSLEEWQILLKNKFFAKHSEVVKFLKTEFNISHGFANTIVVLTKQENNTPKDLVYDQYQGKEELYPIYEKLIEYIKTLGKDITLTPKKAV